MKQFFTFLITSAFIALVLAQAPADLVLVNGKIWTVNDKQPEVEAVAVLGNRIAAIGSTEEIRKWIGANTKVNDLQGKRATPGFNDSHLHFLDGGMGLASVQLRDAQTVGGGLFKHRESRIGGAALVVINHPGRDIEQLGQFPLRQNSLDSLDDRRQITLR